MAERFFLFLSICIGLSSDAAPVAAQTAPPDEAPSAVRFFGGGSAVASLRTLPGFAIGAEADGRLAIAEFLWVGLAAAFSGAPGFRVEDEAACCDMITAAEGDAFAVEGLLRVGFRGPLTPELTVGVLAGLGVAGVHASGTRLGGITGSQDFSEWWAIVEIPVELEFVWSVSDIAFVVGAGPTFVLGDEPLLETDEGRPRVGGRVRLGVLFGP